MEKPSPLKTCKICNKKLPITNFQVYRDSRRKAAGPRYETRCKNCLRVKRMTRIENDPDFIVRNRIHSYKNGWKRLGIKLTLAEAHAQLEAQNYCCAICKDDLSDQKWNYDHDHNTLKLREILCSKCNVGIGMFDDDPHLLILAANYLKRF